MFHTTTRKEKFMLLTYLSRFWPHLSFHSSRSTSLHISPSQQSAFNSRLLESLPLGHPNQIAPRHGHVTTPDSVLSVLNTGAEPIMRSRFAFFFFLTESTESESDTESSVSPVHSKYIQDVLRRKVPTTIHSVHIRTMLIVPLILVVPNSSLLTNTCL
jgi:hypothetical protein